MPRRSPRLGPMLLGAGVLALSAGHASATWSILLADTRTGEVGVASATCLTGIDLQAETPVLLVGLGAATAQSAVDSTGQNKVFLRDLLLDGADPADILDALAGFDSQHQTRQYGLLDATGRAATFSGSAASAWAGGQTGRAGDLVYAVQGNILTGPNVVDDAVAAIEQTPGDLPDKLMAAMEAARIAGGDGRCSCGFDTPTDCGSPPPTPFKSADVGYLLVARAGDTDGCRGVSRVGGRPVRTIAADLDSDGRADDLISLGTGLVTFLNRTAPAPGSGTPLPRLGALQTIPLAGAPLDMALGDVTGDGRDDLVVVTPNPSAITVLVGLGGGLFDGPRTQALSVADARAVALPQLDGTAAREIAVASGSGGQVLFFAADTAGNATPAGTLAVAGRPAGLAALDADGDGDDDLAVARSTANLVQLFTNDAGTLSPGIELSTAARPARLETADLDADGTTDLVCVTEFANSVQVLRRTALGWTSDALPLGGRAQSAAIGDLDGDGHADILAGRGLLTNLLPLLGDGGGSFTPGTLGAVDGNPSSLALPDLDGDGLPDLAAGTQPRAGLELTLGAGDGSFVGTRGCADGEYHLAFNIAFVRRSDPDPVEQIRAQYDLRRAALLGVPDAVVSRADGGRLLPAGGTLDLTVRLLDHAGNPAAASGLSVDAAVALVESVDDLGGGVFRVRLSAPPGTTEDDAVTITATPAAGGERAVVLMPAPLVRVRAIAADLDGDGRASFADVRVFLDLYNAADPAADLTNDGQITGADIAAFVSSFPA